MFKTTLQILKKVALCLGVLALLGSSLSAQSSSEPWLSKYESYSDLLSGGRYKIVRGVKRNGKWGAVDKNGNEVIPCIYWSFDTVGIGFPLKMQIGPNEYHYFNGDGSRRSN